MANDDYTLPPEIAQILVEQLVQAQMKGYVEGLTKGVLMAEHTTGHDLSYLRASFTQVALEEGIDILDGRGRASDGNTGGSSSERR